MGAFKEFYLNESTAKKRYLIHFQNKDGGSKDTIPIRGKDRTEAENNFYKKHCQTQKLADSIKILKVELDKDQRTDNERN
jgi:hypothetical protein